MGSAIVVSRSLAPTRGDRQCVDARNLRGILAEPQAFAADSS